MSSPSCSTDAAALAGEARVPPVPAHLLAQRALVRMLFDPTFAAAVRQDPQRVLGEIPASLRAQLAQVDERALRRDPLRRLRALGILFQEFKGATTLALGERGSLAFLEDFFASAPFHEAVQERGSMPLAYAAFLADQLARGTIGEPLVGEVLALETAVAQARRAAADCDPSDERSPALPLRPDTRLRLAKGVVPVEVAAGAIAALQDVERHLFAQGLFPALAMCADAPRLHLSEACRERGRVQLLAVAVAGEVSLVTVEEELGRLLRCTVGARAVAALSSEAAARGLGRARAEELLVQLVTDELLVEAGAA